MRNKNDESIQQTFLCYRKDYKEDKFGSCSWKRELKAQTICGCEVNCRVHIEITIEMWYIKYLNDCHTYKLMDDTYLKMLRTHEKMSDYENFHMDTILK